MADPLGLESPLGSLRGLPLAMWCLLLLWFWSTEDRVVLGSIFWQSGFPSFVLWHFFLLGVGLGLDMEWAEVSRSFWPHNSPSNPPPCPRSRATWFWGAIMGLKGSRDFNPFHIKPKAHAEEVEVPEDKWRESRLPEYTAEDDLVLGRPKSQKGKAPHHQRQSPRRSQRRFRAQWVSHRSMVEKQPQKKLSPSYWIPTANTLTPFLWTWPLDSAMGATAAHRAPERVADRTCIQVWAWMTNKCRRRMNEGEGYITTEISQKRKKKEERERRRGKALGRREELGIHILGWGVLSP